MAHSPSSADPRGSPSADYQASKWLEPVRFRAQIGAWSLPKLQALHAHCLRLDLIHPLINGNKGFKLAGYARHLDPAKPWLSFGGAYSNHLHALAYYGKCYGITTLGLVRGEDPRTQGRCLSPTLADCERWGMRLQFLPRALYRRLSQQGRQSVSRSGLGAVNETFLDKPCLDELATVVSLPRRFEGIPEGGCGLPGVLGCQSLFNGLDLDRFEACWLSAATGAMLAGALTGPEWQCSDEVKLYAVPVLKAKGWLRLEVDQWVTRLLGPEVACNPARVHFLEQAHWGGYAKAPAELTRFCQQWVAATGIPVEPTYSGKLFYAALSTALATDASPTKPLLWVHCGGLRPV